MPENSVFGASVGAKQSRYGAQNIREAKMNGNSISCSLEPCFLYYQNDNAVAKWVAAMVTGRTTRIIQLTVRLFRRPRIDWPEKSANGVRWQFVYARFKSLPALSFFTMRDNMNITLRIENNLDMTSSRARVGNAGDHDFTTFLIDRPDFLANFSCRAELRAGTNSGHIDIDGNSFSLPSSLTNAGNLELQLVFTNNQNEIIAKTSIVQLTIGNSIGATESADVEFPNGGTVDLSGIEAQISALALDLATAQDRINVVDDYISAINNTLNTFNDSITSINSRLSTNETNIAGLREEATAKWETLNRVEARSISNETRISALETRVSALE